MRLVIRTDASESSDFGTGHVQRMILFAENIKNYGNIFFLMRSKNQFSVSKTIQTKFKVVKINSDKDLEQNTKEELLSILKLKPDIVFFDHRNPSTIDNYEDMFHYFKKKKIKVYLLPHAPHYLDENEHLSTGLDNSLLNNVNYIEPFKY